MPPKVLIVEDEIIVADDLSWKITNFGYEVIGTADSCEKALMIMAEQTPNIVLMDIQLQGKINGVECAKQIRHRTEAAIIFVTAFPATLLRNPEQMQPPTQCLSKPFSTLQLKAALLTASHGNEL